MTNWIKIQKNELRNLLSCGQKTIFTHHYDLSVLTRKRGHGPRESHAASALGKMKDDTVTWFWIGNHDEYERFIG